MARWNHRLRRRGKTNAINEPILFMYSLAVVPFVLAASIKMAMAMFG